YRGIINSIKIECILMEVLMNRDFELLGQRIVEEKFLVAELINEETLKDADEAAIAANREFIQAVIDTRAGFVELLGESIKNSCDTDKVYEAIDAWGLATGRHFLEVNIMLDSALAES